MKKEVFIKHLKNSGCILKREGAKHEIWENETNSTWSTVPRHKELNDFLCDKICKDLGILKAK